MNLSVASKYTYIEKSCFDNFLVIIFISRMLKVNALVPICEEAVLLSKAVELGCRLKSMDSVYAWQYYLALRMLTHEFPMLFSHFVLRQ